MPTIIFEDAARAERVDCTVASVCSEVLLLGEDNPLSSAPEHALYPYPENCSGERLCNIILRMRVADYLATWRTNLCVGRWSRHEAGNRAMVLMRSEAPWRTIVLLGRKVAKIFEPITGFMQPFTGGRVTYGDVTFQVVCIPHPSGQCREWNDPSSFERARAAILEWEPRMPLNIPVEALRA